MTHAVHTLANGLRIVFQPAKSVVGHVALLINAGSRDETLPEQGMAHFIEHNLFKGTQKRKAYHILSRLDDVGGELNAYTTKEETVIHASFLNMHLDRAAELVADILIRSTFPEKELKKEKDVIRDEIHAYSDSPSEQIFDDFENLIFANHPMGRSILGTEESLDSFNRQMILDFIARNYHTEQMVLTICGDYTWKTIERYTAKYFSELPFTSTLADRAPLTAYAAQTVTEQKEILQTHAVLGNRAYSLHHESFTTLFLLNNLLGGPGMNSRLNLNIRERYGFAYNIESFYTPYTDTGVFGIYIGTHKNTIDRSMTLIHRELKMLRDKVLSPTQLHKAQKQLLGQIALSQENNLSLAIALGRSLLCYNRIDTIEDVYARISAITAAEALAVANEIFAPEEQTLLIFKAK
jgi:predicted Zn-dependent peptidase